MNFLTVYLLSKIKKDQESNKNRQNEPFKHQRFLSQEQDLAKLEEATKECLTFK